MTSKEDDDDKEDEDEIPGPSQAWQETRGFVPRDRLRFVRVCARVFHRVASESRKQAAAKHENETGVMMMMMMMIDARL